ncbi:lipopolysaccharide assembly protein LapA domain-containing protein [Novipirellula sp. SH528]|uniref:lipopolysaccharide assembly protein LapA domain-containing protein n=1 Tax=Novipirellula sp. SH528 TaxID=3454466 RepID=UPI003F9ED9C6
MMQKIRWILLLLGIVIALVIAFQNNRNEEVNLLFFHGEVSLLLLILTAVGIGFVFGAMMTYGMLRSKKGKKADSKPAAKVVSAGPASPNPSSSAPKPERADALASDRADAKK